MPDKVTITIIDGEDSYTISWIPGGYHIEGSGKPVNSELILDALDLIVKAFE